MPAAKSDSGYNTMTNPTKLSVAASLIACASCAGCGSNDPSRVDYSGSIEMNILVVVVVAVIGAVAWLAGKISGDDK